MTPEDKVRHFPVLASVMARRYGVTVTFAGNGASTNGKHINLPSLPPDLSDEDMIMMEGLLDHEAGAHGQYFDFGEGLATHNCGIARDIKGILEDVRSERLLGRNYPGCKDNLRRMNEILDRRGLITFPADSSVGAFLGWMFHVAYGANGQVFKSVEKHPEAVRQYLTDTALGRIKFEVLKAVNEPDTMGVLARTTNILQILKEEMENHSPPPQQQDTTSQQESNDQNPGNSNTGTDGESDADTSAGVTTDQTDASDGDSSDNGQQESDGSLSEEDEEEGGVSGQTSSDDGKTTWIV